MAHTHTTNVGCGTLLLFFFVAGFVVTLGVRAALYILGV